MSKAITTRINFYIAFAIGYWIGQSQHGVKPLIIAILLGTLEYYLLKIAIVIVKSWKKDLKPNEN